MLAVSSLAVAIAGGSRGIIVLCAITILMSVVLMVLRRRVLITVIGVGLLVACRSEFVTTDAAGGVGVFPLDRLRVSGVGVDVAAEFAS